MNLSGELVEEAPFWLTGSFAPVKDETTAFDLTVTGSIPPELDGRYFKNGANPPSGKSPHWFLGQGMIHGVEISNGKALWYRNRYVRTPIMAEENPSIMEMANPANSLANTHVIAHAGKIFALEEGHHPIEMAQDVSTIGPYDFGGKLKSSMTAHPKACSDTGELLFFGYGVFPPYLTYYRASASGELLQIEDIPVKGSTMVHDFNITQNYVIFMDLPMVFDVSKMMEGGLQVNFDSDYGARLGVMPRTGSAKDLRWFDVDPCYVFHAMNAYESGDDIVIDVCRMTEDMVASPFAKLHQWSINLKTGAVGERQLDDANIDFPRVPDSLTGKPYRYGYTAEFEGGEPINPKCVAFHKYDMRSGNKTTHRLKNGRIGAEAVFVPAANGTSEDDGYLLSYVYDPADQKSELVILDASNMGSEPIARIHLPTRVPAGFHGSWIANPL